MAINHEPVLAVLVGLLLALSAGVRVTLPLLMVSLFAHSGALKLPEQMAWLGSDPTLLLLGVAFVAETMIHFVPIVGTHLKALATPLSFAAGTLLMAVPLAGHDPIYQWTLSAVAGGGTAAMTNLGVIGARVATSPANVASGGAWGVVWNVVEMVISFVLVLLGGLCVLAGMFFTIFVCVSLVTLLVVAATRGFKRLAQRRQQAAT
jgi:hypothetical protein